MYGIFRKSEQRLAISNQIFETYIYEYLISVNKTREFMHPKYSDKSQYVRNGKLNMRKVLEQFSAFLKFVFLGVALFWLLAKYSADQQYQKS